MNIPFATKLSEVTNIETKEENGQRIFEIQTKFVRYQLILDDEERLNDLIMKIGGVVQPKPKIVKPPVKLPKLYSRK